MFCLLPGISPFLSHSITISSKSYGHLFLALACHEKTAVKTSRGYILWTVEVTSSSGWYYILGYGEWFIFYPPPPPAPLKKSNQIIIDQWQTYTTDNIISANTLTDEEKQLRPPAYKVKTKNLPCPLTCLNRDSNLVFQLFLNSSCAPRTSHELMKYCFYLLTDTIWSCRIQTLCAQVEISTVPLKYWWQIPSLFWSLPRFLPCHKLCIYKFHAAKF